MAINPEDLDLVTLAELDPAILQVGNIFAHSTPSGKLRKATLYDLATFIAPYVSFAGNITTPSDETFDLT